MKTRYAESEDLPQVYAMYISALQDLGEVFKEDLALDFMIRCWSKAPCILLEDNGIIGFAGLNTFTVDISGKDFLREYMFYIKPPYRGIRSWRALSKAVQETADKFKLPFVGDHRLQGNINHHLRLIKMAGARPLSIQAIYGEHNG